MKKQTAIEKFGQDVVNEAMSMYETDAGKILFKEDAGPSDNISLMENDEIEAVSYLLRAQSFMKKNEKMLDSQDGIDNFRKAARLLGLDEFTLLAMILIAARPTEHQRKEFGMRAIGKIQELAEKVE